MRKIGITLLAAIALTSTICTQDTVSAGKVDQDQKLFNTMYSGKYLYTNPDLSLGGGIKGEILAPELIPLAVFALPPHEPKFVYKGILSGSDNRTFEFNGLPPAQYDLFIVFENEVYEGLTLSRFRNTLTDADRKSIEYIVNKSDPFFEKKVIHRVSGLTGRKTGMARAIVSMIRLGPTTDMAGHSYSAHKRNFKLFFLEDVGPGYQVARTRDVFSKFVETGKEVPKWGYRSYLSNIRVTDKVKDLGKIDLSVVGETPVLPDPVTEIDPSDSIPVMESDQ